MLMSGCWHEERLLPCSWFSGLFVIGNCGMLSKKSPDCWRPILESAKQAGSLGGALPLYCRRHDHVTPVACHTDIDNLCPNGGCSQKYVYCV